MSAMEDAEIRRIVLDTLASIAPDADLRGLPGERPLRDCVELDSMDWLNVLAGLQERLQVPISPADGERLTTLDAIVAHVRAAQAASAAPATPSTASATSREPPPTSHLVDGKPITVRLMRPDDKAREAEFVQQLSAQSRYMRFMVAVSELPESKLIYLTQVDQERHVALVAVEQAQGRESMVGVARYAVDQAGTGCEFAIAVGDAWQHSGLAGILMNALMDVARARGLQTMEGIVLRINETMLKFTRQLGFEAHRDPEDRDAVRVSRRL
jgi:acetyltransferase